MRDSAAPLRIVAKGNVAAHAREHKCPEAEPKTRGIVIIKYVCVCVFIKLVFFFLVSMRKPLLDGSVDFLVLPLYVLDVGASINVLRARVNGILLAAVGHLLVHYVRIFVIFVLVAGCDVCLASGADSPRSFLVAATPRCNKQPHDRSRQLCVF